MNQQNAHEYLPLVQAIADGKTVQVLGKDGNWYDSPLLNTPTSRYRIKPEPRTFEMWLDKDTGCMSTLELINEFGHVRFDSLERITVVEVLE